MPAGYDGSVKIGVELDSSAIKNSANELARNIEKALSSNDARIQKMGLGMLKLQDSIQRTSDKMKKLGDTKVPTDKYKGLEATYNRLEAQLEKLGNESIKLQNGAQSVKVVARLKEIETEADKLQTQITYVEEAMNHLKQTGQAFTLGSTTEEFKKLEKTLEYQKLQAGIANQEFYKKTTPIQPVTDPQQEQQVRSTSEAYKDLKKSAASALATLKKVGSVVSGTVSKGFHALRDRIRGVSHSSDDASRNLKKMFRMAIKYVFGLRSVFILYRKIRSAAKEAFLAMAGQFPELQAQVDSLKASFTGLKASLATAFQPLISAVIPILTTIINYITAAMNALGNFFAVLTGQKYVYKATKANNGLAKSIGGTGKAAEKANEALAEYDNLLVIQQDKDSGGGGGGGAGGDYAGAWEKVKAESDFAQKIRDAIQSGDWEGLGKEVANKLNTVTKKLDDWITKKFRPAAVKWAKNIARALNGLVDGWDSDLFGKTVGHGLMALADTIATFFETFKWRNLGKKVAGAINGLFTAWEPDTIARFFAGKFNAVIEFLAGLIDKEKGINFKLIGSKLGETLKRTIQRIEWKQLGADLSGLATGILEGLASFIKTSQVGVTVGNAINEFLSGINFGQLAKDLSDLAINILDALADCIDTVDWVAVGQAIADFLKNINWTKFITTLIKVAFNLVKGLGEALLQIATDPEALLSIAEGLLAIFGAKWIWKKITGLFASNLATSVAEGSVAAAASGGGATAAGGGIIAAVKGGLGASATAGIGTLGLTGMGGVAYAAGGALAGGLAAKVGGQIGAGIGGAISTALGDYDIAEEYAKEAENPFTYWVENAGDIGAGFVEVIKDAAVETHEMWQEFGDDVVGLVFEDPMAKYYKSAEYKENQKKLEEANQAYINMLEKRYKEGRKIRDGEKQMLIDLGRISDESKKKFETNSKHYEDIARKQAGAVSSATQAAIDTSNHYAQIAQSNAQKHVNSTAAMNQAAEHHAAIAKKNAGVLSESQKAMEASSNHYAEIAKKNAQGVETSISGMVASSGTKLAKLGTDAISSSEVMAQAYKDGTTKAETAFSGMEGSYQGMTAGIKTAISTIPTAFETDFNSAYNKATTAFNQTNTYFNGVAEGVKKPFGTMAGFFSETFGTAWKGVVSIFQTNSPEFKGIQDSVSTTFKSSVNSMIDGVNSTLVSPFSTLSSMFSKLRAVNVGGKNIFSSLPSVFSIPRIPRLAQGAVLPPNSPFLAMVGDQRRGTNIEAPLDTIVEALQIALQNNGGNNNQPIILTLNGKQVAQAVWDEENKQYKQTGMRYRYS